MIDKKRMSIVRKRVEISCLTLLGLSLTVAITACKDSAIENDFLFSKLEDKHTGVFASNKIAGLLKANKREVGTYFVEDNNFSSKVLNKVPQLFVDAIKRCFTTFNTSRKTPSFHPVKAVGFISLTYNFSEVSLIYQDLLNELSLQSVDLYTTYLVRAGPHS